MKVWANTGDVEVTSNEWTRADNLPDGYWLYAVYDCATSGEGAGPVRRADANGEGQYADKRQTGTIGFFALQLTRIRT